MDRVLPRLAAARMPARTEPVNSPTTVARRAFGSAACHECVGVPVERAGVVLAFAAERVDRRAGHHVSEPLSWANTQLVAQDPVEAVREMKDTAAESMRTIGSLTLCRSLLRAGLADRFRVVVFPVITGSSGRERIYDGYPDVALEMISSRTFDGRIQLLEYVPAILAGPPGPGGASA